MIKALDLKKMFIGMITNIVTKQAGMPCFITNL